MTVILKLNAWLLIFIERERGRVRGRHEINLSADHELKSKCHAASDLSLTAMLTTYLLTTYNSIPGKLGINKLLDNTALLHRTLDTRHEDLSNIVVSSFFITGEKSPR